MQQQTFDIPKGQKFIFKDDPETIMMRVSEDIHNLEGYTILSSRTFPDYVGGFFMFAGCPNRTGVDHTTTHDVEYV